MLNRLPPTKHGGADFRRKSCGCCKSPSHSMALCRLKARHQKATIPVVSQAAMPIIPIRRQAGMTLHKTLSSLRMSQNVGNEIDSAEGFIDAAGSSHTAGPTSPSQQKMRENFACNVLERRSCRTTTAREQGRLFFKTKKVGGKLAGACCEKDVQLNF